ncbi:hypothetical protein BKA64DRAFT_647664 [Cadophora sp. MPI-SDFR-AT-0126]|nr:hypothetical protein BKA64DRAFT_647664 [Leotiomycetes sp. MPI-SDFR-AT-0126]
MNRHSKKDWDQSRGGQNLFAEDEEPEEPDEDLDEEDEEASTTSPYQYKKHSGGQAVDQYDESDQSNMFLADPRNRQASISHAFQGKSKVHFQKSFAGYRPSAGRSSSDAHIKPNSFPPPISLNVQAAKANNRAEKLLKGENESLKAQLRDIQRERLSALDDFQPCSDTELKEAFLQLQSQVSSLSRQLRSSLSKSRNIATILRGHMLSVCPTKNVPMKYVFESFLWQQLYATCFSTPFIMLGHEATVIYQVYCLVFSDDSITMPRPTEASERWRSITASAMFSKANSTERIEEATQSLSSKSAFLDSQLQMNLMKGDQLKKLFEKAWDAAALFSQQRCRLSLSAPATTGHLTSPWVEVVEEVQHTENDIFGISPMLLKNGTGHGQSFDTWLCLVKSKAIGLGPQ